MAYSVNTFPLVISVKEDGSLEGTVRNIESFISAAGGRAGAAFEAAGRRADSAFNLDGARRQVERFAQSVAAFTNRSAQRDADPLGIRAGLAALSTAPFQRIANERIAAENALAQQKARASAEAVVAIQREFDAAMQTIRARGAAQTAAFNQAEAEGNRLIALDRQRANEMAKLIAAPQRIGFNLDSSSAEVAASAARSQAMQLEAVARAAEQSLASVQRATLTDRAYADGARQAAEAAKLEADRLRTLAETQRAASAAYAAPRGVFAPATVDTRSSVSRLMAGDATVDRAVVSATTLDQVLARVNRTAGALSQGIDRAADGLKITSNVAKTAVDRLLAGEASIDRAALSGVTLEQVLGRVANRSAGIAANIARAREASDAAAAAADRQAQALARAVAEAGRLVAAPAQAPALYFNPAGTQAAATAARQQANALEQVAAAARIAASAENTATAADRAFALTSREAAAAAGAEASRLEALAATQGRVAAAARAAGISFGAGGALITNSARQQRFATIQASQQFQDFFVQVQGGQNVMLAFSQQASQLAFVMAGAGGAAGRFANFFAGPWGTLIFAGISVLTAMTVGTNKSAKAHEAASVAATIHAEAVKRLQDAVDRLNNSQASLNHETTQGIKDDLAAAEATRQLEIRKRGLLDALLRQQLVEQKRASGAGTTNVGSAGAAVAAGGQVAVADQAIADTNEALKLNALRSATAERAIAAGSAKLVLRGVEDANDKATAATHRYEDAVNSLQRRFEKGAFGNPDTKAAQDKFFALTDAAKKTEKAALAAAKATGGSQISKLNAQAALAAADSPVEKARAQLALTKAENSELLRQGVISADTYRQRVQAADVEVQRAEGLKRAAAESAKAAREYQRMLDYAQQAGDSIRKINGEFDDQPRLVDRATTATQTLNETIAKLQRLKPPGFKELIADAEKAKGVVENGLTKPYRDLIKQQGEQYAVQQLVLQGRQAEADALQLIIQLENTQGKVTQEERDRILANVEALHQQQLAVDAVRAKQQILLDALASTKTVLADATQSFVRGDLGQLLKTPTKLLDVFQTFKGQKLFENLLGPSFRELQDQISGYGSVRQSSDEFATAVQQVATSTQTTTDKFADLRDTTDDVIASFRALPAAMAVRAAGNTVTGGENGSDVVVTARPLLGYAPSASDLGRMVDRILRQSGGYGDLSQRTERIDPVSAAVGHLTTSIVGLFTNPENAKAIGQSIGKFSGKAFEGAATGSFIAGISKSLGLGLNQTGSTVGGAVGGLLGDKGITDKLFGANSPIGKALGSFGSFLGPALSVVGGLVGSLFTKIKRGGALVTSANGPVQTFGNDSAATSNANSLAGSVQSGLQKIASTLNAQLGSFNVSIGTFDGKYRVSTTGYTGSLDSKHASGLVDFGKDGADAAVQYAILDAIRDGAIKGIRQGAINLLKAGKDLDTALQKALSFQQVFKDLKARLDPVGAAIDEVDAKFDTLRATFAEASATAEDYAQLEQLYALERADAIKDAQQQLTGTLKEFLDTLNFKGDNGLSLRTREAAAKAAFEPLAATVQSGGKVDQDAFTSAAQTYLDIERELYGSSQAYFDKLAEITQLTSKAIANAGALVSTTASQVTDAAAAAQGAAGVSSGSSLLSGTGAAAGTIAANDNTALPLAIAQAIAAQTTALQIPADRVAMMAAPQITAAIQAAFASSSSGNVVPLRSDDRLIAAIAAGFADQRAAIDAQTGTITQAVVQQLTATNRNLGTLIQLGDLRDDPTYQPARQNF
ncbi:hypothetical protein [Sphingomonas sp. NFR15]|uniref:hypothetical protein n=1 Tax=Sphingomonas sp. NFR15 TaxID=1566282 RepID=UPI000890918E|nr:hypothetical protein [Sphingomonas sp. NFR15]SDA14916.1 Chromosome segregation ATPase [Sphingomonas sp. NFR15]